MIISASRRTDIPAFYSDWFMSKVREGMVEVQNPFRADQIKTVSLRQEDVDIIVFWSKNPAPLVAYLKELDVRGFKYYFLFTINAYPGTIEPSVPPLMEVIDTFRGLSDRIGPGRVIWRFDPILITSITSEGYIADRFGEISDLLRGYTERVIISFAVIENYRKVLRSMKRLRETAKIDYFDITTDSAGKRRIAGELHRIADGCNMEIYDCAEEDDLSDLGVKAGSCIDQDLISKITGISLNLKKDGSQRGACGCVKSRDIGRYDTCRHGCVYCYATGCK